MYVRICAYIYIGGEREIEKKREGDRNRDIEKDRDSKR